MKRQASGFTLIELLIVVLIIAILAAIAVPNLLEFQTRAKIAGVFSDFRTLKTALESYYVDNNDYPAFGDEFSVRGQTDAWGQLTTPIAYISTILFSPFKSNLQGEPGIQRVGDAEPYRYYSPLHLRQFGSQGWSVNLRWLIQSVGPDTVPQYEGEPCEIAEMDQNFAAFEMLYSPTNGTVSPGDLLASNKRIYN